MNTIENKSSASQDMVSYAAPPIKYQYVCPAVNGCYYAPASGSLKFKLLNRRTNYIFAYITESNPYREIKGVSSIITYNKPDLYKPMHTHLSTITDDEDCGITYACMQVMWIQKATENPMIKYGTSKDNLDSTIMATEMSKLKPADLCGQEYGLPAGTSGYFDNGYMITVYLQSLKHDTQYFYQLSYQLFLSSFCMELIEVI